MKREILEADLTFDGETFRPDVRVAVGEDGRIEAVGALEPPAGRRLKGRALLPGFVNVHSHAFQRGLRGSGESFPAGAGSFWSWREAMYLLVDRLDGPAFEDACARAFREMRAAGVTTVGEFHYLHHGPGKADRFDLDARVLSAARKSGIRLVLLHAYYRTGGIGAPLRGAQERFATRDPGEYWDSFDALAERLDPETQSLGAVAHSIRAADLDEIAALHEEARRRDLVFHMHVEEQEREIEESVRAYGKRPMALLLERLSLDSSFTAVHCTHTDPTDLDAFLARGGHVCLCPTTEANLGDGICDGAVLRARRRSAALGTDSNARISFLEEMRWLEYAQRLARRSRGVLASPSGGMGDALFRAATEEGARSLGIEAGRIAPGCLADFATIDLSHPSLDGWTPDTLADALVFGGADGVVAETCVGGEWSPRGV